MEDMSHAFLKFEREKRATIDIIFLVMQSMLNYNIGNFKFE